MPQLASRTICQTPAVRMRDVHCAACRGRHAGAEEADARSHIVFPYRGAFVRRIGRRSLVADINQALFFNAGEGYRVDHPLEGGDDCVAVECAPGWLDELRDGSVALTNGIVRFRDAQRAIGPGVQLLLAGLRHLETGDVRDDLLGVEQLALALLREVFGARRFPRRVSPSRRRLVERTRLLLHSEPARRWSLGELASELGASPVYLTHTFSEVEGISLYRYQTRLRLGRALQALGACEDFSSLAQEHGFSSHSQFTAAFVRTYRQTPSALRREYRRRIA